jgi:hypothetical protein
VTLHTLRPTALSRMIDGGLDDYTVMALSGHSSAKMLERYTHPTEKRQLSALASFDGIVGTRWAHSDGPSDAPDSELAELPRKSGGRQEARTPDLRVANAALSQLS